MAQRMAREGICIGHGSWIGSQRFRFRLIVRKSHIINQWFEASQHFLRTIEAIVMPKPRPFFVSQPSVQSAIDQLQNVIMCWHSPFQGQPYSSCDIMTHAITIYSANLVPRAFLTKLMSEAGAKNPVTMCFGKASNLDTREPPSKPIPASGKHVWTPTHPVSTRSKPMGNGSSAFRNKWHQENLARNGGGGGGSANAGFTRQSILWVFVQLGSWIVMLICW